MLVRAFTLAVSNAPKITEWISAISTATLGVVGLLFTRWQWKASGFRPTLSARIDARREAIELKIDNKGRAAGVVEGVYVLQPKGNHMVIDEEAIFEGFTDEKFRPVLLPGFASMRLVIEAPEHHNFSEQAQLKVELGSVKDEPVPLEVESKVSLFGLKSVLPPGTKT